MCLCAFVLLCVMFYTCCLAGRRGRCRACAWIFWRQICRSNWLRTCRHRTGLSHGTHHLGLAGTLSDNTGGSPSSFRATLWVTGGASQVDILTPPHSFVESEAVMDDNELAASLVPRGAWTASTPLFSPVWVLRRSVGHRLHARFDCGGVLGMSGEVFAGKVWYGLHFALWTPCSGMALEGPYSDVQTQGANRNALTLAVALAYCGKAGDGMPCTA